MHVFLAAIAIASCAASPGPVSPTTLGGAFISGNGIPSDGFTLSEGGGVEIAIRARGRDTGTPVRQVGTTAIVLGGQSALTPASPWWVFDFQFTPPPLIPLIPAPTYVLRLDVDSAPGPGTGFTTISAPIFDADADPTNSWDDTDGFFFNGQTVSGLAPVAGAWSDPTIGYVVSQSWRVNFPFLGGATYPPGDYKIRISAFDSGLLLAKTAINVRVLDETMPALTLDPVDACLGAGEDQLVVEVNVANAGVDIIGGQFFLGYDASRLAFVSAEPGDAPFDVELHEVVNGTAGTIDYAVRNDFQGLTPGTPLPMTMARLTFDVVAPICEEAGLVAFRTHLPPTRLTVSGGADIQPDCHDLSAVTHDPTAPTLSVPPSVSVVADLAGCLSSVNPGLATSSDACDPLPSVVGVRSDGFPLGAPYPSGQTVILWTSVDACGNVSQSTTSVGVTPNTGCPCDWNADCVLNDQDFFDWANDYFNLAGPQGMYDFNTDGFQNDQDWFDFVNCFFGPPAPCGV